MSLMPYEAPLQPEVVNPVFGLPEKYQRFRDASLANDAMIDEYFGGKIEGYDPETTTEVQLQAMHDAEPLVRPGFVAYESAVIDAQDALPYPVDNDYYYRLPDNLIDAARRRYEATSREADQKFGHYLNLLKWTATENQTPHVPHTTDRPLNPLYWESGASRTADLSGDGEDWRGSLEDRWGQSLRELGPGASAQQDPMLGRGARFVDVRSHSTNTSLADTLGTQPEARLDEQPLAQASTPDWATDSYRPNRQNAAAQVTQEAVRRRSFGGWCRKLGGKILHRFVETE